MNIRTMVVGICVQMIESMVKVFCCTKRPLSFVVTLGFSISYVTRLM